MGRKRRLTWLENGATRGGTGGEDGEDFPGGKRAWEMTAVGG